MLRKAEGRYVSTTLDDELVLMNIDTGAFHALNGTGKIIWDMIDGTSNASEIVTKLTAIYDVPPDVAQSQVNDFVTDLKKAELLID